MKVIREIRSLREALARERQAGKRIGFVPTMGALHDGHLSLVERCRREKEVCVVSIFVNPTQFNDQRDLAAYPRTPARDCALLSAGGCDYVFAPSEAEMYPEPDRRVFNLGAVAHGMEGAFRPGHFNGVAQIVSKLFRAVEPDSAYFGEKDFQQVAVVREMVKQLGLPVQIVACPILREPDGLAMSSRNARLTAEQRRTAPRIAAALEESRTFAAGKSVREVIDRVVNTLNQSPPLRVEYFEIVDGTTLLPIRQWNESAEPVGCIAVYCGEVRLIDNVKYEPETKNEHPCN
ncbi:MAG: pantoate--beta-alanine ligase [Tannerella sp.]|jgi:pantoate--beta-alanine ligase|nr:pantoate--beta-alanine ligase [Tannerella sp.]